MRGGRPRGGVLRDMRRAVGGAAWGRTGTAADGGVCGSAGRACAAARRGEFAVPALASSLSNAVPNCTGTLAFNVDNLRFIAVAGAVGRARSIRISAGVRA